MQLTKEEVVGIMNTLQEIPLKYSAGLFTFFQKKLDEESKNDVEVNP